MPLDNALRQAIVAAAREAGINPAFALAVAERESNFDPRARSSKTIRGLFQMRGDLRRKYGIGDSDDPYTQAKGWTRFIGDERKRTAAKLGRDPTDSELYLSHHFGSGRAARMLKMAPDTPVESVFTPYEMSINPHFAKAGTVGRLNSSILADIDRRQARYGGAAVDADFSKFASPADDFALPTRVADAEPADYSQFGVEAEHQPSVQQPTVSAPDFSQFGVPA